MTPILAADERFVILSKGEPGLVGDVPDVGPAEVVAGLVGVALELGVVAVELAVLAILDVVVVVVLTLAEFALGTTMR